MSYRMIATCKLGLENVVVRELRALQLDIIEVRDAQVLFSGDAHALSRALLWLRTAERILLEIGAFEARSFEELFEGVKALNLKRYLPRDACIHVKGKSAKSTLFSVSDCQSITKKAIVENLKSAYRTQIIPETGEKIIVEIGLLRDVATLALDACGAGLSRRGYRMMNVDAPISETLAAGIVLLSKYRGDRPFLDPMCGSGTIPIEASLIAMNKAPGLLRSFAAEDWRFIDQNAFSCAREEAQDLIRPMSCEVMGGDIDEKSIQLCKQHAKRANVMLSWQVSDMRGIQTEKTGGILACNPPYGERLMKKSEAALLYRDMRKAFDSLIDWSVHVITANNDFERAYGIRAHKRRKLNNGGIPCTLYQYFPKQAH